MGIVRAVVLSCLALGSALVLTAGCSDANRTAGEHVVPGTLTLELVGQTNGVTYRLRNAIFDIVGPVTKTLNSEVGDPNATSLETTLDAGTYLVNLESGWALERLGSGNPVVVDAVLISPNPVSAVVSAATLTKLVFQFRTNNTVVNVGTGDLNVAISVVVGDGGTTACSLLDQASCPCKQGCYLNSAGTGTCQAAGKLGIGQVCAVENDCSPGLACAVIGTERRCAEFCDLAAPNCSNGTCGDAGLVGVGLCSSGGLVPCSVSDPATCPAGDACYPIDLGGGTRCLPIGSNAEGAACNGSVNDCAENLICLDPTGAGTHCFARCDLASPACPVTGETCSNVGIPDFPICH